MIILITGGSGSLGKALIEYYHKNNQIICLSRNEENQWKLKQKYPDIICIPCDISRPLDFQVKVDIVIHAAALKSITTSYLFPLEVKKINIDGTINILAWAQRNGCKKFIYISTDKAVEPINFYGASKFMAEKLVEKCSMDWNIVRFGNLFGSSQSVVPLFLEQYKQGKRCFNISSEKSERYFLTLKEAVKIIETAINGLDRYRIGQYKTMRIIDFVKAIDENNIWKVIGLRPGEKEKEKILDNYPQIYYTILEIKEMIKDYQGGDL